MSLQLQIIKTDLLPDFLNEITDLQKPFDALHEAEISTDNFSFYTSVASVFSSKIEGEEIDLDSYIKHKHFGVKYLPDYTKKIDDLYNAYTFAKTNKLNKTNIEKAHTLLGKHIVAKHKQGKLRTENMYVLSDDGKIEYVAASPYTVETEMNKWFADLNTLLATDLNIAEVFYYAAFLHLAFVKIHPWNDGNGRSGRLIEKWFLAQKLGEKAWFLQSEKYYYTHHQTYYNNLRVLGLEYDELHYSKAMPFLLMLPNSLNL